MGAVARRRYWPLLAWSRLGYDRSAELHGHGQVRGGQCGRHLATAVREMECGMPWRIAVTGVSGRTWMTRIFRVRDLPVTAHAGRQRDRQPASKRHGSVRAFRQWRPTRAAAPSSSASMARRAMRARMRAWNVGRRAMRPQDTGIPDRYTISVAALRRTIPVSA